MYKIKVTPGVEPSHSMWRRVWGQLDNWDHMHAWLADNYGARIRTTHTRGFTIVFDSQEQLTAFVLTWG
jgi:hypothetical protein